MKGPGWNNDFALSLFFPFSLVGLFFIDISLDYNSQIITRPLPATAIYAFSFANKGLRINSPVSSLVCWKYTP